MTNQMDLKDLKQENERLKEKLKEYQEVVKRLEARGQIIIKVNALLDKTVHELSVVNKVNKITTESLNIQQVSSQLLDFFSSVIDIDMAGLFLSSQDSQIKDKLFIQIVNPILAKYLRAFKEKTLSPFKEKKLTHEGRISFKIINSQKIIKNKSELNQLDFWFYQRFLETRGRVIGSLSLARSKEQEISKEEERMIELICENTSVGLENTILHQRIERLAVIDGLTSVYNHRQFIELLKKEIERAKRYDLVFSLLFLDIDDFKKINDTYGHLKGDEVLKNLADIIEENVHRKIDSIGRYGGEEFGVILPNTNKQNAFIVAERIRDSVKKELSKRVRLKDFISVSIGIATFPEDGLSLNEVIHNADLALYRAKQLGKNKTCFFSNRLTLN